MSKSQLVTNRHVVEGARRLTVDSASGAQVTVKVAATAVDDDLAIVTTVGSLPAALRLGADPDPGALVTAMGFPLGGQFHASPGRVVDLVDGTRFQTKGSVVRSSVTIRPGNSGGPLLDGQGRVVGVVYAVELQTGMGLALPVSRLRAVLAEKNLRTVIGTCKPGG